MQTTLEKWRRNRTHSRREDLEEAKLAEVYDLRVHHGAQARRNQPTSVPLDVRFQPPKSLNEMIRREQRRKEAASGGEEPAKLISQHARDLQDLVSHMKIQQGQNPAKKIQSNVQSNVESSAKKSPSDIKGPQPAFAGVGTRKSSKGKGTGKKPAANGSGSCPSLHAVQESIAAEHRISFATSHGQGQQPVARPSLSDLASQPIKKIEGQGENDSIDGENDERYALELLTRVCVRKAREENSAAAKDLYKEWPQHRAEVVLDGDTRSKRMRLILNLREEISQAYVIAAELGLDVNGESETEDPALLDSTSQDLTGSNSQSLQLQRFTTAQH